MKQVARPATAAEVLEIVGALDDVVLMRILEIQATPAEVLEAAHCASSSWNTRRSSRLSDPDGSELLSSNPSTLLRQWPSALSRGPVIFSASSAAWSGELEAIVLRERVDFDMEFMHGRRRHLSALHRPHSHETDGLQLRERPGQIGRCATGHLRQLVN